MNKQHGFIQGALLIGIALLAVVIGAFAMASNNNTSDVSKEKAKTSGAVAVKKMADMFELYQIKAATLTLSAADDFINGFTDDITLPQGFGAASYYQDQDNRWGRFYVNDQTICAAINRVTGVATSSDSDADAVTKGQADAPDHCFNDAVSGKLVYQRKFR